jgi:hypothetical protein
MGLRRRLEGLEERATQDRPPNPDNRARMKAVLGEIADARRNGRPLSPEAAAVCEYFRRRWERGSQG